MRDNPVEQVISDLFQYLESLETQSAAVGQLLKDKGLVTDDQLTHYLEQAGVASSVKWRAARARMEHLFAAIPEPAKHPEPSKEKAPQPEQGKQVKKESAEKAEKGQEETNRASNSAQQVSPHPHGSPETRPKEGQHEKQSGADARLEDRTAESAESVAQPSEKPQSETKPKEGTKETAEKKIEPGQSSGEKVA